MTEVCTNWDKIRFYNQLHYTGAILLASVHLLFSRAVLFLMQLVSAPNRMEKSIQLVCGTANATESLRLGCGGRELYCTRTRGGD